MNLMHSNEAATAVSGETVDPAERFEETLREAAPAVSVAVVGLYGVCRAAIRWSSRRADCTEVSTGRRVSAHSLAFATL